MSYPPNMLRHLVLHFFASLEVETLLENKIKLVNDFTKNITSMEKSQQQEEYTEKEIMDFELQYIGFRLTIDEKVLKDALEKVESLDLPNIKFYDEENKDYHWGIIRSVEKLTTKKGKPYVNVRMDDGSSFRIWHNKLVYLEEDLIPSTVCLVKLQSDTFGRSLSWDKYSFLGQKDIMKL